MKSSVSRSADECLYDPGSRFDDAFKWLRMSVIIITNKSAITMRFGARIAKEQVREAGK